jgi:thiosulfate/3-mercaptopyruvate sulfurtransferase
MDRCGSARLGLCPSAAAICISLLFMVIYLHCLTYTASAGTETGEFCPDCPDWSNLEGWLAQKEAYEQAQQNGPAATANSTGMSAPIVVTRRASAYPIPAVITQASSSMAGWIIVDVRSPEDYRSGHIPGARNVFWRELLNGDSLDFARAEITLRQAGINSSDPILIYGGSEEGPALVFWALSYLGQKNLSLLDGGIEAALAAGIKCETSIQLHDESNYTASPVPWLMVTEGSLGSLLNSSQVQIMDARDFIEFGKCHLTSAAIPFEVGKLLGDDNRMRDSADLADLFGRRSLDKNGTQLVYGTPGAYSLFYGLRLMGYNATLLEGDWWEQTKWAVRNVRQAGS